MPQCKYSLIQSEEQKKVLDAFRHYIGLWAKSEHYYTTTHTGTYRYSHRERHTHGYISVKVYISFYVSIFYNLAASHITFVSNC